MKNFLIDTENVSHSWLNMYSEFSLKDKVLLFYTKNTSYIPRYAVEQLAELLKGETITLNKKSYSYEELEYLIYDNKIPFECIKCLEGKNALDFQLVSYLGMMIFENPNADFIIISDDNGYNAVVHMWRSKNIDIKRQGTEKKVISIDKKKEKIKEHKDELKELLQFILKEDQKVVDKTFDMMIRYYITDRKMFFHSMKSIYGKQKGTAINDKIKNNKETIISTIKKIAC